MHYFSHSRSISDLLLLDVRIQRCMHLDVLQSPDRPVPVARGGSPSGFAKVAVADGRRKKGRRLELESEGENEGAGKPESKFGGRTGGRGP